MSNLARRAAVVALAVAALGAGVAAARAVQDPPAPAGAPAAAPSDPSTKKATVADLAWMAGAWRSGDADGGFEETWLAPAGGTMVAVSREVKRGRTPLVELSSIEADAAGDLHLYIRHFNATLVPWKSETEAPRWKLASVGAKEAVFEEPSRDFPRTVTYRAGKDDTLEAVLDGKRGDRPMHMEFKFSRAK